MGISDVPRGRPGGPPGVPPGPRGLFFVFEGLDGAGKSTQARLLVDRLRRLDGPPPLALKEPSEGPSGRRIRELYGDGGPRDPLAEMELFLADRAWDVRTNLEPALAQGRAVVMDRYLLSQAAYQGALGLQTPAEILQANAGFPWPDLTFVMEIAPDEGLARAAERGLTDPVFEKLDYLVKVKAVYDDFDLPGLLRLDARRPPAELAAEIGRQA
ncbi:MAG: dTMP kinase, partial [Deltaproteobacteria bacterium]|nr:dTMP kinase [Deltaproteobacteria bacterium]